MVRFFFFNGGIAIDREILPKRICAPTGRVLVSPYPLLLQGITCHVLFSQVFRATLVT